MRNRLGAGGGRAAAVRPPAGARTEFVPVPGTPFAAVPSLDGSHVFVSLPGREGSAIAVLEGGAALRLAGTTKVPRTAIPRGLALERAGRYLLVAAAAELLVLDTAALVSGEGEPIVARAETEMAEAVQVAVDPSGRFVFTTNESDATVSVFDFGETLSSSSPTASLATTLDVPPGPVGCAVSPDGRLLFVTSQSGEDGSSPGALSVFDLSGCAIGRSPELVARADAGRCPVRVALTPAGDTAWVSDRGGDRILAFDVAEVVDRGGVPPRATVPVGPAPVGLALARAGSLLLVANSNRYRGRDEPQTVSIVDVASQTAETAVIGTVAAGVFPREVAVLPDDETAVVTNFGSKTVETVHLGEIPLRAWAGGGPPSR